MATYAFVDGVNEREPTQIPDGAVQGCSGMEYRVGEIGPFVARGRDLYGTISGVTGRGMYEAGFDGTSQYVVAHVGNSLHAARIVDGTLSFALIDNLATGSSEIVGAHYANRHYTATSVANRRLEATATGITAFAIGMSPSTFTVGVSVTQGVGTISATTGLVYWATEYDSARGIESVTGSSASTGAFSLLDSIVVTVTGTSQNPRATHIRWYRSTDGGGFPDGGLVAESAIGTTQITDTLSTTGSLSVPLYGIVSIGGLDTERDEAPPVLSAIFGPFQDSMLGVAVGEPRVLRFTPAGYPDSWPSGYGIPLETSRRDEIIAGVVLTDRIGVFCNDSIHVVYRLPRDSDSIFAAGEAQDVVTLARGTVSRRGVCAFTPIGHGALVACVSRDGIWATNLVPSTSPMPLTDKIRWEAHVSIADLATCRLMDDPENRRLVFLHRRVADTTYSTGIWYLDYQEFQERGIRVTFANHGPLADAVTVGCPDGCRRAISIDSRSGNGQVYQEATQDVDDSQLVNSSGAVTFRLRTKEFLPAGPRLTSSLGNATWMHDAGPATVTHRFYHDRRDAYPDVKTVQEWDSRRSNDVPLGKDVNSVSLEIESTGTVSYGVHWVDLQDLSAEMRNAREGA